MEPGDGFYLVEKLLNINKIFDEPSSRNTAPFAQFRRHGFAGVFNSIKAHDLDITRAAFCGGESPYRYIQAFHCDLFLSTYADDVRQALAQNIAAATFNGQDPAAEGIR